MNDQQDKVFERVIIGIVIASVAIWVAMVATIAIQAVIIHRQSRTIKELTTVCERLSQVFEEAEEGTATAIEPEQNNEGITNL